MARVVIFGCGDVARLAHHYFSNDSSHEVVAFCVDDSYQTQERFCDLPVVAASQVSQMYPPQSFQMFVAISYQKMNLVRADKYFWAKELGYQLTTYISSRCTYLSARPPGDNCFILEDNTIQPFVQIGNDVTLWSGNHIGHDAIIEDHCFITSHVVVSGHVRIRPYCFIGVNATLRNSITLGEKTLIGAGAIIMKDTSPQGVYLPERAKLFEKKSEEISL